MTGTDIFHTQITYDSMSIERLNELQLEYLKDAVRNYGLSYDINYLVESIIVAETIKKKIQKKEGLKMLKFVSAIMIAIFCLMPVSAQYEGLWKQHERVYLQVDHSFDAQPPDSVYAYADGNLFQWSYWNPDQKKYDSYSTNPANGVYYVSADMFITSPINKSVYVVKADAMHMSYIAQSDTLGRVFTTRDVPFPDRVTLSQPAHQATGTSTNILFRWQAAMFAEEYQFQLDKSPGNFANPILNVMVTETEYQVNDLEYNTTYQWRVRARNGSGWGEWSGEE